MKFYTFIGKVDIKINPKRGEHLEHEQVLRMWDILKNNREYGKKVFSKRNHKIYTCKGIGRNNYEILLFHVADSLKEYTDLCFLYEVQYAVTTARYLKGVK